MLKFILKNLKSILSYSFTLIAEKSCGSFTSLKANFHSEKGLKILTEIHNYKGDSIPYDDTFIYKKTIINENVWIGMNVMILPGVEIGEGFIIQAGSIVVNNLPKLSIAGGHPCRVFFQKEIKHITIL